MVRLFVIIFILVLIEVYSFIAFKQVFRSKPILVGYGLFSVFAIGYFVSMILSFNRETGQTHQTLIISAFLLLYVITKIVIAFPLLLEDVFRILSGTYNFFFSDTDVVFPFRKRMVSIVALGIAVIPFCLISFGIIEGKYNYKVINKEVYFNDLPDGFDGLKILQISDIHSGSLNNKEKIEKAINLINKQDFDMIVFTGDMVNNFAYEMYPWIESFNKIKTPKYGKFSVLGNHDYGEYAIWKSQSEKQKNFEEIKNLHNRIGFRLLLNENVYIDNDSDKIAVVGVENWGHNFKKAGDLNKASENLKNEDFKILLSHDPSHFDLEVKKHPKNFHLTLSGHTHGLQFGIEFADVFKWSPVQYVYKKWAGLYEESGKYIYINRGFGFHAYSGRVGIWPEITVLELKKKQKS